MNYYYNPMKKYLEKQKQIKEYKGITDSLLYQFENIRNMAVSETDPERKRELCETLVTGYHSFFDSLQIMFGDRIGDSFSDDTEALQQLVDSRDVEEILRLTYDISLRWRIGISSICHGIMSEAAENVPEIEIRKEIQEVLDLIGNEVVLSGRYDLEYPEETEYMRKRHKVFVFPYNFTDKYDAARIDVYKAASGYKYVDHQGKKLYFPDWDDVSVQLEYNQLILEQDPESPHQYFDEECSFEDGGIFVDVGAAEGIISLSILERAEEVYLIECTDYWIKALNETFKDYKDKVHIIPKYAGAVDSMDTVTIDTLLSGYVDKNIFIKMDIEGMEPDVLLGAHRTFMNNNCRVSCAVYHTNDEKDEVMNLLKDYGYRSYSSDNYMLFIYCQSLFENGKYERPIAPYFRKGIVRGVKDSEL